MTELDIRGGSNRQPEPPDLVATVPTAAVGAGENRPLGPGDHPAIRDWDDLFRVMRQRLGEADAELPAMSPMSWNTGMSGVPAPRLLQAVAALHQLHPTVMREIGRCDALERDVIEAHSALARVRGDLIGDT